MIWVNGSVQATIAAADRGLAYGDGLFATMRTNADGILWFETHQARVNDGAARLGFDWQMGTALCQQLTDLAKQYPHHCIKLLITRGVGGRGYAPPCHSTVTEVVSVHPIPAHYAQWQQRGVALQTSTVLLGHQPLLAGIKHLNRLEQVLIRSQPLAADVDDWLVLDCNGKVIESSMANLFFIKDRCVFTPSLAECGVSGVMREQVIRSLLEHDYSVDCVSFGAEALGDFDSAFMTNSLLGIVDVIAIDALKYTPSPITAHLRQILSLTL
ncbi:aminodeoxychorismate lyase [Shewanella sp.]|uniref:aminodeoxychorismate lyase n=1 Tax=Shewanella sp. TaxID=50422 RepID=UPI003F3964BC